MSWHGPDACSTVSKLPRRADVAGLTYDTGALIAGERTDRKLWALHRSALERQYIPTVPAGVLAQAWRGGPQAQLSRLLAGCRIEELDEPRARSAGAACAAAGTSDIVDASVVVGASARGDLVVTSDADDLIHLKDSLGVQVRLTTI
jgi:hypothetical protein